jgi:murein DD-endopeptidase MepM/ murein hydrolase activator NlpD
MIARRLAVLMLLALAACGPRLEPPAPVTIHGDGTVTGGPPPASRAQRQGAEMPPPPPPTFSAERGRAPPPPPAPPPAAAQTAPGAVLTVQSGQTLYAISRQTGVPVRDLIDANHLDPPFSLNAGQQIVVPQQRRYTVRAGDSLSGVAQQYGVDESSLARANNLQPPYSLHAGDTLILPAPVEQAAGPPLIAAPPEDSIIRPPGGTTRNGNPPGSPPEKPLPGAASSETTAAYTPPAATPADNAPLPAPPPRGGNFLWPAKGKVIESFGTNADGTHNDGINIAAARGAPVRAADTGIVAYAGNELRGYGNLVLVKHAGGFMTAYAHNDSILVKRGETVKRGQEIAKVGSTGINGAPQLHFEIRRGSKVLDPDQYLPSTQASAK